MLSHGIFILNIDCTRHYHHQHHHHSSKFTCNLHYSCHVLTILPLLTIITHHGIPRPTSLTHTHNHLPQKAIHLKQASYLPGAHPPHSHHHNNITVTTTVASPWSPLPLSPPRPGILPTASVCVGAQWCLHRLWTHCDHYPESIPIQGKYRWNILAF